MLLEKIESVPLDAPFAKKREDVLDGDIVEIVSDAERVPDRYNSGKFQTIVKVKTRNGEKYVSLSQTSINILISEFKTNDATKWIGKEAKILLKPTTIGGKKVIALYLTGKNWILDEFGSPVKEGTDQSVEEDIPTIEEGGDIKVEDLPF